jgi:protein TonB
VTLDAVGVDDEPEISNRFEVTQLLSRSYPPGLRDAGIGGSALARVLITENGRVDPDSARVLWATRRELATAALVVVRQMRFAPMRMDGRPVAAWTNLPVSFSVVESTGMPVPPGPPRESRPPTLPPRAMP